MTPCTAPPEIWSLVISRSIRARRYFEFIANVCEGYWALWQWRLKLHHSPRRGRNHAGHKCPSLGAARQCIGGYQIFGREFFDWEHLILEMVTSWGAMRQLRAVMAGQYFYRFIGGDPATCEVTAASDELNHIAAIERYRLRHTGGKSWCASAGLGRCGGGDLDHRVVACSSHCDEAWGRFALLNCHAW